MYIHCLFTIILFCVLKAVTGARSYEACPRYCVCHKSKLRMNCDGRGGVLKSIPRPPSYVKSFHLTNTDLGEMTKEVMRNLTFCKLENMVLKKTIVPRISYDALSELKYLEILDWEQGYFPISEFVLAVQKIESPLTIISIKAITLDADIVSASSFLHLKNLQTLSLQLNAMKSFNTSGLKFMKHFIHLDLSNNQLKTFQLSEVVPHLRTLKLGENDLTDIPTLCLKHDQALIPKLEYLNLEENAIRILNTSDMTCLRYLNKLILSQNRIEYLRNNSFADLPALNQLQLSRLTSLRAIEDLTFNSSSLSKLLLVMNPKLSTKRFNPKILFTHAPNLTDLDMTNTNLGSIATEELKDFLLTLKNIKKLVLQKTTIKGLPVGVFSELRQLTTLILSGNSLQGWDSKVFADVTSIKHIFIDGNNIKIINETSFPLKFRLSVKEINLSNNPFTCTCDLLWFRTWMKEVMSNHSVKFTQFPYRYDCKYPNTDRLRLVDFNPTLESCTISQLYFAILVIVLSVCIVFTVAGLVTYRYRWYILYWISLMRRRRQRQGSPAQIQYDGFVSYSNPDWDWVSSELVDYLEGPVGLRLCEHSRDFKAGMYIVDNVIEAMDTSRKTILVISNEYMKSDWCQFELRMALSSFLQNEIVIVVILLEHIKSSHVSPSLRALMMSVNYIEWSEDEEAKKLFKEKLKNAMRD